MMWLLRVLIPEWPESRKVKQTDFDQCYAEHPEAEKACQFNFQKTDFYAFDLKNLYDTKIIFSCAIWSQLIILQ